MTPSVAKIKKIFLSVHAVKAYGGAEKVAPHFLNIAT
jgi:hypothetical protein